MKILLNEPNNGGPTAKIRVSDIPKRFFKALIFTSKRIPDLSVSFQTINIIKYKNKITQ